MKAKKREKRKKTAKTGGENKKHIKSII